MQYYDESDFNKVIPIEKIMTLFLRYCTGSTFYVALSISVMDRLTL